MTRDEKIFKLFEGAMFGLSAYCRFFDFQYRWMSVAVSILLVFCAAYAFRLGWRYEWYENQHKKQIV